MSKKPRLCDYPDCCRPHHGSGFCVVHYFRFIRHEDPSVKKTPGKRRISLYDAISCRELHKAGVPIVYLAQYFGLSTVSMSKIINRQTYKNAEEQYLAEQCEEVNHLPDGKLRLEHVYKYFWGLGSQYKGIACPSFKNRDFMAYQRLLYEGVGDFTKKERDEIFRLRLLLLASRDTICKVGFEECYNDAMQVINYLMSWKDSCSGNQIH